MGHPSFFFTLENFTLDFEKYLSLIFLVYIVKGLMSKNVLNSLIHFNKIPFYYYWILVNICCQHICTQKNNTLGTSLIF